MLLLLLAPLPARAESEEAILSFGSDIAIAADGGVTVTETLAVRARGRIVRRGIVRDLPLTRRDARGESVPAGWEILAVSRDGRPEAFHTETAGDVLRLFIGEPAVFLPPAVYTYTLTYRSARSSRPRTAPPGCPGA